MSSKNAAVIIHGYGEHIFRDQYTKLAKVRTDFMTLPQKNVVLLRPKLA